MGQRGPKTIPTEIRLARGTHVNSRHGDPQQEPKGVVLKIVPDPPESLKETGIAKWKAWGPRLQSLGMLEERYLDALEMYCRAWDRLVYYQGILDDEGEFYTTDKGYVGAHPAATGLRQAREDILRYQREFGITPSASTGVKAAPAGKRGVPNRARDMGAG